MYASKDKLQYPIIDKETNLIREKTQEELKIEGKLERKNSVRLSPTVCWQLCSLIAYLVC